METFRDYGNARPRVEEFYESNHTRQTLAFVIDKKREYLSLDRKTMTVWEALDFLNTLVDDSDPDIEFTQIEHALQTAEAIRAANQPRWFIATGLVHDLGKILCLFGEPQWAVVGDTFPVGCRFSQNRLPPIFSRTIQMRRSRRIRRRMASTSLVVASTRFTCRGVTTSTSSSREGSPAGRSAVHDPLSLVLPLAQRRRVQPTLPMTRIAAW